MRAVNAARRAVLWLTLAALCLALGGCDALRPEGRTLSAPDLSALTFAPYEPEDAPSPESAAAGYYRVDLWLDGTQNAGGINPEDESMYPHTGRKYREGGFHYRYGLQVGWYESVLRGLLGAAEGTRVRLLRYGNERVPDAEVEYIAGTSEPAALASVRRDLMTYALDPDAGVFGGLSAEKMDDSFYSLGASQLNQMARFLPDGGSELENPGKAGDMSAALDRVIAAVGFGGDGYTIAQSRDEHECALLEALNCLDLSRLSVLTVDPASMGRMAGADAAGKPVAYYEEALRSLGVFDRGLSVGLYVFRLDYMGQLKTVCAADLAEPLIWGRLLSNSRGGVEGVGAMPRDLLTLVIGPEAQVADYMGRLNARLDADDSLRGTRGPREGELSYASRGETVTQQPFAFSYDSLLISRPATGYYTQHTPGAALSGAETDARSGLQTALLTPGEDGRYADQTLTVRVPLSGSDAAIDPGRLTDARLETLTTLLLSDTLPNTAENASAARDGQTLAYRDTLYVYRAGEAAAPSPFTLRSARIAEGALVFEVAVSGARLTQGYYRLLLRCDVTGEAVAWPEIGWLAGESAEVTADDAYAWETFTAAMSRYDRDTAILPKQFQHAWGPYTDKLYHGLTIPDCPPVWKALNLSELVAQLRAAAAPGTEPMCRYALDVFADNQ